MQLHQLKPLHRSKKARRVGRGGKRGTYSGRGVKGQKSRAGRKMMPLVRTIVKRYPKVRGYRYGSHKVRPAVVNLKELQRYFEAGQEITAQLLVEKGAVNRYKGKIPQVKILGSGELKKAVVIRGCKVSKGAKEKIEKAGGKVMAS